MIAQFFVNGLVNGCMLALVAFSFALIYNTTRVLHIAHGAVYTVGAYLCFVFVARLHWPMPVAVLCSLLLAAALGMLTEVLMYAPLRRTRAPLLVSLISSLGLYTVLVNIIAALFGNDTQIFPSGTTQIYQIDSVVLTRLQVVQAGTALIILPTLLLLLRGSRLGKMIRAARDNPTLTEVMGVRLGVVRIAVFALGSAVAAGAAIISALDSGIDPDVGLPVLLAATVGLIIGGINTFSGAVLGGFVLGVMQGLVVWKIPARWTDAIVYSLFILFLVFRPEGIIGKRRRLEEGATG